MSHLARTITFPLLIGAILPLAAVEPHNDGYPRLGAEVLVGTSGIEPGAFAEWRLDDPGLLLRPEVFVNEDGRPGFAGAVAWEPSALRFDDRNSLAIGPRIVYHNSDDSGWEVDALAIWSYDLMASHHGRHYLEVIGALGVLEKEDDNDNDEHTGFGGSIGIGYGYQF